jgi:hypothetical protein
MTLAVPPYITTYVAQTNQTLASGAIAGTGLTTTTTAGALLVGTNSTNGLSLGVPAWITTYVAQTVQTQASGNIAATGFATTTTNGTVIVGTNNTTGLTLAVPAFLTTYAAQTSTGLNVSAGAGTSNNLTGITFVNSNSITFGLSTGASVGTITASVAYPAQTNQTVGFYALSNTTSSLSSGTFDARSMSFNAIGPLSVGYSAGSIVLSAATVAGQTSGGMYATGNTTNNSSTTLPISSWLFNAGGAMSLGFSNGSIQFSLPQTSSLVGVGNISVSTNGSTISIYENSYSTYVPLWPASTSSLLINALGVSSANPVFFPYQIEENLTFNMVAILQSYSYINSAVANSETQGIRFGLYSNNASTWSQISSGSSSIGMSNNVLSGTLSYATATSTSGYGYGTTTFTGTLQAESLLGTYGFRNPIMQFGGNVSLTPGWYALGLLSTASSTSANGGINQALVGNVVQVSAMYGIGQSTTVTNQMLGMGYGTATTSGLPASMAFSNMTNSLAIIPIITFAST